MRFLPAGDTALLVELDDLDQVLALLASLDADRPAGVLELVPAARTLAVLFDPGLTSAERLGAAIRARDLSARAMASGREVDIPTRYDGADLAEVAALTGLDEAEIIARHTGTPWRAAFTGFAPGFCYLTGGDPALEVPRRATPRTAVPAGAVALAGAFSAVYPRQSPGGWQLIGTTPLPMWDIDRDPPAWLRPGDIVRFTDLSRPGRSFSLPPKAAKPAPKRPEARLDILAAPFPLLFQDRGRAGRLAQGVAASGAADMAAFRALNRMLGNPPGTPALEIAGGGLRLRASAACTLGLSGAGRRVTVNGSLTLPAHAPIPLDAGDEIVISAPESGVYGYLGARGGFAVASVLGSAATDTLAHIGPKPLVAGGWVGLAHARAAAVTAEAPPALPRPGDIVEIEVIMGPRADWFPPETLARFTAQDWLVTQESSRIGKRLEGEALTRPDHRELPSEATMTGAIQIPHSGQPVLFLADHPLTGGYPVIATVAPRHLSLAAQAPPGARLRFCPRAPFAEITPKGSP